MGEKLKIKARRFYLQREMKPLVIYHANCMDGAAAALAAWLKFGDEAEYRPANYGDPAPTDDEMHDRHVYVLDFSYSRAELDRMFRMHCSGQFEFCVLDHHKTAQADLDDFPFCVFDMRKSGAVMAWEYFHCSGLADPPQDKGRVPELFRYVQDRDLWRWELLHSREVSAALAASGALTDFRALIPIYRGWAGLEGNGYSLGSLVTEGAAILRAERFMIERIAATAEEVEIEYTVKHGKNVADTITGERVRALATTSAVLQSEVGEALAIESARRGRDAVGVVYYRDGAAGKWHVSLRSCDGVRDPKPDEMAGTFPDLVPAPDVSAVAKSFGGGGHAKAAGFECVELPWVRK